MPAEKQSPDVIYNYMMKHNHSNYLNFDIAKSLVESDLFDLNKKLTNNPTAPLIICILFVTKGPGVKICDEMLDLIKTMIEHGADKNSTWEWYVSAGPLNMLQLLKKNENLRSSFNRTWDMRLVKYLESIGLTE